MNDTDPRLPPVLVTLFRGVLHRDEAEHRWHALHELQAQVSDYVSLLGLELMLDEVEGYAYLRQRAAVAGDEALPRLVARRQLGFAVSLLLALLRKKLAEHDADGSEPRLVLTREQIAEMVTVFAAETSNEARFLDRLDADLNQVVRLGFLRRLRNHPDNFEVRRILKAFVDAQWLAEFEHKLQAYREHLADTSDRHDG